MGKALKYSGMASIDVLCNRPVASEMIMEKYREEINNSVASLFLAK